MALPIRGKQARRVTRGGGEARLMHRKTHYVLPSACNAADNASDVLRDVRHMYNATTVVRSITRNCISWYRTDHTKHKPNNSRSSLSPPPSLIVLTALEFVIFENLCIQVMVTVMHLIGPPVKDAINAYARDARPQTNTQIFIERFLWRVPTFIFTSENYLKFHFNIINEKNISNIVLHIFRRREMERPFLFFLYFKIGRRIPC